jgi:arylsulfatase A-like enzyme
MSTNIADKLLRGRYFDPYRIPTLPSLKKGEYLTDRLADETIAWMKAVPQDTPMFVCLWTYNPHYPFEAPADLIEHFLGKVGPGLKNPIYGGQIEATDRAVGRVLDALDDMGIVDQTLVLFTSDNGGWTGATDNRPLRSGKGDVYEGGIRVPLIIRWPGVTSSGTTDTTPVISMDLTATIFDAAGVELDGQESLDGVSLRPVLAGDALEARDLFWHYPHFAFHRSNRPASAMREGKWKLIRRFDDDSLELYDLSADRGETRNLAGDHPELAEAMNARLEAWLVETDAGRPTRR